jgi:glycogen debranching enzyme
VFYRNGVLASAPIALCEVQAYVFAAKKSAAQMAAALQLPELFRKLAREAEGMRHEFERQFWDDDLGTYVLALDGEKKPCRVRTSNAGHCLWAGIAGQSRADRIVQTLMAEDLFCGWGIRTLGSGEVRYNPMAYHNGSVWPHDNALIAAGFARYGHKNECLKVLGALFEAANYMELNRLPELYCGFHKRSDVEGPTLYPVACSPQAWAAGCAYMLFEACLGIEVQPESKAVEFTRPQLPPELEWVELTNLQVGSGSVDVRLRRIADGLSAEVRRNRGECRIHVTN